MTDRVSFILVLFAAASFSLQAQEQGDITRRVRQLRAELFNSSSQDDLRLAGAGYLNGHIKEVESLVQADVIQALNAGDTSNQLLARIRPMVQGDWKEPINVLRNKTPDGDLVVVGYTILHGGSAMPIGTSVLEGFQNRDGVYRAVQRAGYAMSGTMMQIRELKSPRLGEMWFFAHGQQLAQMQYSEKLTIYSFDGHAFSERWATSPKSNPEFDFRGPELRITYEAPGTDPFQVLTIGLTPAARSS